ncbi:MAG: MATE family efflux transporter [Candidatus Atribacteria bacterium]|nr:MATE family efflux transporter [Candidatus Atribacteria bacterium]
MGSEALGGLAVIFPLQILAIAIGMAIGNGTASITSIELGHQKKEEAAKTITTSVIFSLILGILLPLILIVFKKKIIYFFGATENIYPYAEGYYTYIVYGFVFIFLSFLEINIIKAEGNAKLAAIGMFLGTILNVILDPIFIFVFHMGTAGAAFATVISRIITTLYLSRYYLSGKSIVNLQKYGWRFEVQKIKQVLALGAVVFFNQIGFFLLTIAMNLSLRYYGTSLDISIYGVFSRIYVFVTMPFLGLAQGIQPIIGYNFGAEKYHRIKQTIKKALIFALSMGLVLFVITTFFPAWVLCLFTKDSIIIQEGVEPLRMAMLMTPFIGFQILSYFFFLAINQPFKALFVSLSRQAIFTLPLVVILPLFMDKMGIWVAYPVADVISAGIAYLLLSKETGKMKQYQIKQQFVFASGLEN